MTTKRSFGLKVLLITGLLFVSFPSWTIYARWYENYQKAEELVPKADTINAWNNIITLLEQARQEDPNPGKNKTTYGVHTMDYYPYLRLGQAHLELGKLLSIEIHEKAREHWEAAEDHCETSGRYGEAPTLEVDRCLSDSRELIDSGAITVLNFEGLIPNEMANLSQISINGIITTVDSVNRKQNNIKVLGKPDNLLKRGLNYFVSTVSGIENKWLFWNENNKLKIFSEPYEESHAILIAIDDYRKETGFDALGQMVNQAKKLEKTLQGLGFPSENIQTFYNEDATSENIKNALQMYWEGEIFSSIDRLFLYFGGHGELRDDIGYLVTFDFDPTKPSSTSVVMEDLINVYARDCDVHHMLIVLDACYSGITVLGEHPGEEELREFRKYSLIKSDTEPIGRNLLVAATEKQEALYNKKYGGVFTQALIDGFEGDADMNDDKIIQFEELGLYVRNEVIGRANGEGKKQEPQYYIYNRFGEGRMVFLPLQN
ncbi:MAG: caspase family protein [Tissierellales bacterium]|nr:caspase family protein [Tissierellales bacterium]